MTRLVLALCGVALVSCEGGTIVGPRSTGSTPGGPTGPDPVVAAGCEPQSFALTRLNRRELDASLKALWGDTVQPARLFTADSVKPELFDNDAQSLAISPRLLQDFEAAAPKVIDDLWSRDAALLTSGSGGAPGGFAQALPGSAAQATVGATRGSAWNLWSNGEARFNFSLPAAGTYTVTVTAYAEQAGTEPAKMDLWANGALQKSYEVTALQAAPAQFTAQLALPAGAASLGVRFTNDAMLNGQDRNLFVVEVKVQGAAAGAPTAPAAKPFVRVCAEQTDACAQRMLEGFTRRAWRRPATAEERAQLLALVQATRADGDDFEAAVKLALRAALLSPHFLLRTEAVLAEGGPRSGQALASRLSFFLWSGPPDDELDARADDGTLKDPAVLEVQVKRMLDDARAQALRPNLLGQWFESQGVEGYALDPGLFPGVNAQVMRGVQQQADAYLAEYFFADRDALDALDANVTFVDSALAGFLGLPAPGSGLSRVTLEAGSPRAGWLGQSAPLIVTSKSTETSPPRRGKYVIERLLCEAMPLPTGLDIPPVPPATAAQPTARDRLEALTAPASCQGCHARLNPIGFALEPFAADSRYRTTDHNAPIDPKGALDGKAVDGVPTLAKVLKAEPRVERCMVQKTLSFALGRPVQAGDAAAVAALQADFGASGRRYQALLAAVAKSPLVVDGCRPR